MTTTMTKLNVEDYLKSKEIPFQKNVPLSSLSTWQIGGPADFLVEPSSETQIKKLMVYCGSRKIPFIIIGRGSNLLFDDTGLRGIVLRIDKHLSAVSVKEDIVVAQSGLYVPRLARIALHHGLSGLEHTVGIPGNLGGLLTMNGGSQQQNLGNCVKCVRGITTYGEVKVFNKEDCSFDYRKSVFQFSKTVITEIELKLEKKDYELIRQEMLAVLRSRRKKFPRKEPNCGSVFKSNPRHYESVGPPGRIIEEANLKGLRIGNVEVSRKHANFIVNKGGAKASDVLELIRIIRSEIYNRIGFSMRCEVKFVKSSGEVVSAETALD